jgi:hypothetical protein
MFDRQQTPAHSHSERSEESAFLVEILHFVHDDKQIGLLNDHAKDA